MKIAIISQARVTSKRFPNKNLIKIKDRTLLEYHIDRLKNSQFPLIIATSNLDKDRPIVKLCQKLNVNVFTGNHEDVLNRFYRCCQVYNITSIIRVTADCPLIDVNLIDKGWKIFNQSKLDYLSNTIYRTYPRGFDFEIFTFEALKKCFINSKDREAKEHVTPYIWRHLNKIFKYRQLTNKVNKSNYRLTVDTLNDFKMIKILIEKFHAHKKTIKRLLKS